MSSAFYFISMLQVNNISFEYSVKKTVLTDIHFSLEKGEHLCIMGESGCGKSTLLKLIYGLLDCSKGTIFWNNIEILGPKYNLIPGFEKFKYVAQDFDLMPYTTVSENISKFLSRFYPKEAATRTQELLEVIEMTAFANEKVKTLSGGQQQRVAIARALAKEPELILFDEPFSQIDNFKKNTLRRNLFNYLKRKKITCIVATHDGNDALSFADKMLIIRNNKVILSGNPKTIYQNPKNIYIASLFDDVNEIKFNGTTLLKYPHQLKIVKKSAFKGKVKNTYFKGLYWLLEIEFQQQTLFISHSKNIAINSTIFFKINLQNVL